MDRAEKRLRVALVDDHRMFLDVVAAALRDEGFEVPWTAATGRVARAALSADAPDVVVIDLTLEGGCGLELAEHVRLAHPDVPVLMFSSFLDDTLAGVAARKGLGVVPKVDGLATLTRAVQTAAGSGSVPRS